jgi:hypothetical protein
MPGENRRYHRILLRTPIRWQVRGSPESNNTVCDNISAGGLSFICDKFFATQTPVMLEVKVLSRIIRPIGKIAWTCRLGHCDKNRLGIEFLEVDPKEKDFLQDFISMQK